MLITSARRRGGAGRRVDACGRPSAATKSASWVTVTTPCPSSRSSASRSTSSSQVRRSWPKVGSSRTSRRGAVARAVATLSRRASPPERVYGLAPASRSSRSRSSSSSTVAVTAASGWPVRRGPSASSSQTGAGDELVLRVLEDRADPPGQRAAPATGAAECGVRAGQRGGRRDPAGAGPEQAAEQQRQGGLAGAVRAEHGERLAGAYRQVGRRPAGAAGRAGRR